MTKRTVHTLQYPRSTTELCTFSGLRSVYQRFVSSLAWKAVQSNKLIPKEKPKKLDLDDDGKATMKELNANLVNPPILSLPIEDKRLIIKIDTCDSRGCVPLQPQDDRMELRSVGYWSSTRTNAEPKYDATQPKYLEVVWAVYVLKLCVERSRLTVWTVLQSLK